MCALLPRVEAHTQVLVVMHHFEAVRSTNTGRLAARMLTRSSVRLRGAKDAVVEAPPAGRRLVLYPAVDARPLVPADATDDLVLVVPDGTWTQARRIHRRDPACRDAATVTLPFAGESGYGLRRNPRPGGLCTLEAIAAALGVLEGPAVASALLAGFQHWCARAHAVRDGTLG